MRPFNTSRGGRRGTITVIVVAFLVLFFIMALTFAFYSIAESDQAKVYRDTGNLGVGGAFDMGAPPDQEALFSQVLADAIYGPQEGLPGAFNVLRGHDLARLVYGYDPSNPTGATQAFNGIGRVAPNVIYPQFPQGAPATPSQAAIQQMINFAWARTVPELNDMLYEIDNNNYRHPITGAQVPPPPPGWGYRSYAKNANYTYPDLNNLFLGAIDPKSGKVLMPSYHRPYLMVDPSLGFETFPQNPGVGPVILPPFNAADTNPWTNQAGRLLTLRPRPVDHQWPPGSGQSYFPYPLANGDGTTGDVENLPGKQYLSATGIPIGRQYDSVWIDPDLPVRRWQGKNYKPLVAMLIVDLDGRVNVNTAGNFTPLPDAMQPPPPFPLQYEHTSTQGIGPWEVNPAWVMGNNANEAAALTRRPLVRTGVPVPLYNLGTPPVHIRFGGDGQPNRRYRNYPNEILLNQPSPGSGAAFYAQVDFDGRVLPNIPLPPAFRYHDLATGHDTNIIFGKPYIGQAAPPGNPPRPDQDSRYGNGLYVQNFYDERTNSLTMYGPYLVRSKRSSDPNFGPDRAFSADEMRNLNEKYNYGKYEGSDLAALAPNTLGRQIYPFNNLNSRFAITTISNDLGLPGASPWITTPNPLSYLLPAAPGSYPSGTAVPFVPTSSPNPAPGAGDHDASYRARLAQLGPVDLNRKLTEYRRFIDRPLRADNFGNFGRAVGDRQILAKDIFERLRYVTTGDLTPPVPGSPNFSALRWLAQLSVNIVDYIDNDDLITPFNWTGTPGNQKDNWVYGFERPRLEMNESYTRLENAVGDMGMPDPMNPGNRKTMTPYSMRTWLELHNPVTPGSVAEQNMDPLGDDGTRGGYRALLEENVSPTPAPPQNQSAYRILVYQVPVAGAAPQDPMQMRVADNTPGLPGTNITSVQPLGWPKIVDFSDTNKVKDATGGKTIQPNVTARIDNATGKTFYVIGPIDDAPMMGNRAELPDQSYQADLTNTELNYQMADNTDIQNNRPRWVPGYILQRLANPYAVYSGPANQAGPPNDPSNPYVTIDYLEPDTSLTSIYDHTEFHFDGMRGPAGPDMRPDLNTTFAWGRRQPYDARVNYGDAAHYRQGAGGAAMGQMGGHTFAKHNAKNGNFPPPSQPGQVTNDTLQQPFLPLNHMDRVLLNPVELLHVVATKPHELTQSFFPAPGGRRLAYAANWLDQPDPGQLPIPPYLPANQSTFLFRALDYLRMSPFFEGTSPGGRVPGRINLNTDFSTDVFTAVADPNQANRFALPDVGNAWTGLMGPMRGTPAFQITANDRPLVGLGTAVTALGQPPGFNSQDLTIARMNAFWQQGAVEEIVIGTSAGAAQKYELMSKVFNNFTTRSNTFAVYATIGYFQVMNDGPYNEVNRPILGKEMGVDEGTSIRHKFFSIIDRTNLTIEPPQVAGQAPKQGQAPVFLEYQPNVPLPNQIPVAGQQAYEVIPDPYLPSLLPQPTYSQVTVRIPATGQFPPNPPPSPPGPPTPTVYVSGIYDGVPWTIADDPSHLVPMALDIGPKTERVYARMVPNSFDRNTGTALIVLESEGPQFTQQHDRGATLRLKAPDPSQRIADPGNPGPQTGFQYRAPRYAPVVRYAEQLK